MNRDGLITAYELYRYVAPKVRRYTDEKQNVYLWPPYSTNVIATDPYNH